MAVDRLLRIPPQPAYLYYKYTTKEKKKDKSKKKFTGQNLFFDGITKVEHSMQLKIEDDPSNRKKNKGYVNGALTQPSEVKMEVYISQIYTPLASTKKIETGKGKNKIKTDSSQAHLGGTRCGNRGKNAMNKLVQLQTDRTLIDVYTDHIVYKNMLISNMAFTQDDAITDGFYGTITFHELVNKAGDGRKVVTAGDGSSLTRTPSAIVSIFGAHSV